MFCVVPVAESHPRYRRRYRSRSSESGALLCRSKAAGSVKIFSNMTNLHDDGPSARAQIYVASITAVRCPAAAQKLHRAHKIRRNITNSVFRLAARRTELCAKAPQLETAPVSEKRVGLSRCPRRPGYGRLTAPDRLAVRAIGGFRSAGWHLLGHPPGFRVVSGGGA